MRVRGGTVIGTRVEGSVRAPSGTNSQHPNNLLFFSRCQFAINVGLTSADEVLVRRAGNRSGASYAVLATTSSSEEEEEATGEEEEAGGGDGDDGNDECVEESGQPLIEGRDENPLGAVDAMSGAEPECELEPEVEMEVGGQRAVGAEELSTWQPFDLLLPPTHPTPQPKEDDDHDEHNDEHTSTDADAEEEGWAIGRDI